MNPLILEMSPRSTIADVRARIANEHPQRPPPADQILRTTTSRLSDDSMTLEAIFAVHTIDRERRIVALYLYIPSINPGGIHAWEATTAQANARAQLWGAAPINRDEDQPHARIIGLTLTLVASVALALLLRRAFKRQS